MIEKHFTLDPRRSGFDHAVSLDPAEFERMVEEIRAAETMLGTGDKVPTATERANARRFRRRIVARRRLDAGTVLSFDDVAFLRLPDGDGGSSPAAWWRLAGRRLRRSIERHEPLTDSDVGEAVTVRETRSSG